MTVLSIVIILIVITVIGLIKGLTGNYRWYILSAVGSYVFSFLSGFSIGLLTLIFTFISLSLLAGKVLGLIKNKKHLVLCALTGSVLWAVSIYSIDDYWLFLPMQFIIKSLY